MISLGNTGRMMPNESNPPARREDEDKGAVTGFGRRSKWNFRSVQGVERESSTNRPRVGIDRSVSCQACPPASAITTERSAK